MFITAKFIPALRKCFDDTGYTTSPHADDVRHTAEQDSTIWVVVNGIIYLISCDYAQVTVTSGIYAIGSGQEFAMGALQALMPKKTPSVAQCKKIALRAMHIASYNNFFTAPPFHVFVQAT